MNIQKINEELFSMAKTPQGDYYKKVVPFSKPSIGVKVPELRRMAKSIAKEDYKFFMENYKPEYLEQQVLKAFVIGYAKDDIDSVLHYADMFVPTIHDWMVNDAFCQNFSIARKYRDEVFSWLEKYIIIDSEYSQRVVSVILMSHFMIDTYCEKILSVMDMLKNDGYYNKMGIAWCVATCYAKFPDKTLRYLNNNKLDDWTFNKAIQKMLESYRVPDADKIMIRKMKR